MVERVNFSGSYIRRIVDSELDELLSALPAILLDGPKAVGKTSTANQHHQTLYRLDEATRRELLAADLNRIKKDDPPVLIDEWQLLPQIWDTVRRAVDEDQTPGRFILTGSMPGSSTHSGAARITNVRVRPLALAERLTASPTVSMTKLVSDPNARIEGETSVDLNTYVDEILAGGLPAMRSLSGRPLRRQLDSYLDRIVDHDLAEAGFKVRKPQTVTAWLRAYAAATATTATWETIRDAASQATHGPKSKGTTGPYIELLKALRILDPVPAWTPSNNHLKRLNTAEKHHLADPALATRLLQRNKNHLLNGNEPGTPIVRDGTFLGALFESLTALSVRVYAQAAEANVYHLRTHGGRHEIDFIVENENGITGIEVKLSGSVNDHDVKHLHWLKEKTSHECLNLAIITTGTTAYRRSDGIAVIPLALLGP